VNDNVKRLAVANGPNIFQMLLINITVQDKMPEYSDSSTIYAAVKLLRCKLTHSSLVFELKTKSS